MNTTLTLLIVLLFFVVLAVAGPRWGADTRAAGGWRSGSDPRPLWPIETEPSSRLADPPRTRR